MLVLGGAGTYKANIAGTSNEMLCKGRFGRIVRKIKRTQVAENQLRFLLLLIWDLANGCCVASLSNSFFHDEGGKSGTILGLE